MPHLNGIFFVCKCIHLRCKHRFFIGGGFIYSNGSDPAALLDVLFDVYFIICMGYAGSRWGYILYTRIKGYRGDMRWDAVFSVEFRLLNADNMLGRFRIKQSKVSPFMSSFIPLILGYCWFYYEFLENLICFFETFKSMMRMEFGFTVWVLLHIFLFLCISCGKFIY